jgi:hypothetical protein
MESLSIASNEFADLKSSACFRRMTGPQKNWLIEYLKTGSIHAATCAAYPDAKSESKATMGYQIQKSQAVMDCLDFLRFRDAQSSRRSLIDIVRKQLEAAEPGSVSAQRLCAQLQSLTLGAKAAAKSAAEISGEVVEEEIEEPVDEQTEEPTHAQGSKVGDIILQGNQKYRVLSVDEAGKPLTATEVL